MTVGGLSSEELTEAQMKELRLRINDPGSFTPRGDDYTEPIGAWSTRAVAMWIEAEFVASRLADEQALAAAPDEQRMAEILAEHYTPAKEQSADWHKRSRELIKSDASDEAWDEAEASSWVVMPMAERVKRSMWVVWRDDDGCNSMSAPSIAEVAAVIVSGWLPVNPSEEN